MAVTTLPAVTGGVTLSPAQLSAARAALVARIDAAAKHGSRRGTMPGMPGDLVSASCYLVAHGVMAPASKGEFYFAWDSSTSRQFLDGLDPAAHADELEQGRAALFDGRRAICKGVLDAAADLVAAGDRLARARVEADATADALRNRWAVNAAANFARRGAGWAVAG